MCVGADPGGALVGEGFGEIFDIEAAEGAKSPARRCRRLKAGMLLVGGIVRDDAFIPAKPKRSSGRATAWYCSAPDYVKKAEKLFSVGVGVF